MRVANFLAVLFVCLLYSGVAHAKRIALVIGNADYSELTNLQKTLGDAGGYRDVLDELGFDVTLRTDLDFRGTALAVGTFVGRIQPGDEVAFVFAGHGWSDGRTNYLLPTDTPKRGSSTELAQLSLPLKNGINGILDQFTQRGATLSFSVIDACRDNPFIQADGTRSAGLARGGLTGISASPGSFVIYSAAEGQTALDRLSNSDTDPYSVFSRVFLPKLGSGVSLEQAADETQLEVSKLASQIGHNQQPAYYDQAAGQTILKVDASALSRISVTPNPPPSSSPQPSSLDVYATMWEKCEAGDQRFCRRLAEDDGGTGYGELATVLIAPATSSPPAVSTPAPAACNAALLPDGWACGPNGQPQLQQVVMAPPPPVARPAVPSRSAFGIPADKWTSGTPGADLSAFREGSVFPEMVVIPAGSFTQGSTAEETNHFSVFDQFAQWERPQRPVSIPRPFALARTEVTVGEWRRFLRETDHDMGDSCFTHKDGRVADLAGQGWSAPGFAQGEDHPVVCVSWNNAKAYVGWLNGKLGHSVYRLASESEWEHAARARTRTARFWGEDGGNTALCTYANGADTTIKADTSIKKVFPNLTVANCNDGYAYTSPVGRFLRNNFGLSDMLGNVLEWTEDCFEKTYSSQPTDGRAYSQQSCNLRVLRGGSWNYSPERLRSASRFRMGPDVRSGAAGFRVARTLTP